MSELRREMVQKIVDSEARRNGRGEIIVYFLNPDDGGGRFEVAGVNDRYHPEKAAELRRLVEGGRPHDAEKEALEYIAAYTDRSAAISDNAGLKYNLRDCAWNRGPTGAVTIMQIALGVTADGRFGPISQGALHRAEEDVPDLLQRCRTARETYEKRRGRDESSRYWEGLVARWDRVLDEAIAYDSMRAS